MNFDFSGEHFGKILCSDIDGVILKRTVYKGNNVFDEAIDGAKETLEFLHENGWYIMLFTSRLVTIELIEHLDKCGIEFRKHYDDINGRRKEYGNFAVLDVQDYKHRELVQLPHQNNENKHWVSNPPYTSIKPIASVYLDDMSWENEGKNYTKETWLKIKESLTRRFK